MNFLDFTALKDFTAKLKVYISNTVAGKVSAQTKENIGLDKVDNTPDNEKVVKSAETATKADNGIDTNGDGTIVATSIDADTGVTIRKIDADTLPVGTEDDTADTDSIYGMLKSLELN